MSRLSKVEEEGERLGQEVVRLAAASRQEVTVRRKENKMVGEQLMRLLETLDGISLDQDMFELRARRKKAAARINSLISSQQCQEMAINFACWYFQLLNSSVDTDQTDWGPSHFWPDSSAKVSLMSGAGEQASLEAHHSASEVCDMLVQVLGLSMLAPVSLPSNHSLTCHSFTLILC